MSTFHSAASSLAIQYRRSLRFDSSSTLAVLIKIRTNIVMASYLTLFGSPWWTPSQHGEPTPESLSSV